MQKVLGEGGLRLLSTFFILWLARTLGAENFGRYSSAWAVATLCVIFVDLGTNAILTREIARHPTDRIRMAESSHLLKVILAIGSWCILLAATYALHFSPSQRRLTLCLGVVAISQVLLDYLATLLNGIEEMGWEAILKVVCRAIALSFAFWALWVGKSLMGIAVAMAWGSLAGYSVAVAIVHYRFGSFGFGFDKTFLKSLLRASIPLFGCVLFWVLYDSQDVILLNYFRFPQQQIGWFSAAMKIIDVLRVYPVLMMGVFFPVLSRLHASDPEGFRLKERRLFIFMTWSLLAVAAIGYAAAPLLIRILYKSDYMPASDYLRLLMPPLVGMGINFFQMQVLIALDQERKLFAAAVLTCVTNLVFACLLLPRFGVPGICYALLGSEIIYFLYMRHMRTALRQ